MASSTNQESQQSGAQGAPSSSGQHNLAMQRLQQQELLKLIAQHFHSQFYQMGVSAAQSNVSAASNQLPSAGSKLNHLASSSYQRQSYHQNEQSPTMQRQQQQQGGCLNLAAPQSNTSGAHHQAHLFHQQSAIRSQQMGINSTGNDLAAGLSPNRAAEVQLELAAAAAAISAHQQTGSPLNLYPPMNLHDMNLLSALGLNLTNNQLVLSLQQQSLLQAAAAARQYEMARGEATAAAAAAKGTEMLDAPPRSIRMPASDMIAKRTRLDDEEEAEAEDNYRMAGAKERQLKFSIKTILGGSGDGSPQPAAGLIRGAPMGRQVQEPAKSNNNNQVPLPPFGESAEQRRVFGGKLQTGDDDEDEDEQVSSRLHHHHQQQQQQRGSDYDGTESCNSDSSSIDASLTPTPQTSANLLFARQTSFKPDHNHPSATQLTGPAALMTAGNLASVKQFQQQQPPSGQHHLVHQLPGGHHQSLSFLPASGAAFPWTVAARGKPRRGMMRRAVFSDGQRVGLEKRFQLQKYISKPDRKKLAEKLGLRDSQVKIWFQNRRMKWRNSKERELLSAGGSREQTLPTRNNPNPDLSDVGETIKRLTTTTSNGVSNVSFNK